MSFRQPNITRDYKENVELATTANITLSGHQSIDSVTTVDGYRVLVKDQTDSSEDGLYDASSGAWTRSKDADQNSELTSGVLVFVAPLGSTNGSKWLFLDKPDPIIIGTTLQTWTELGGGSGDVTKVGTPVDNEIGVWTGNGTLEGDTNFTWSGSQFKVNVNGTAAAPMIVVGNDAAANNGFYRPAVQALGISINGIEKARWTAGSLTTTNGVGFTATNAQVIGKFLRASVLGTASAPSIGYQSDTNTGIWFGTNALNITAGGQQSINHQSSGLVFNNGSLSRSLQIKNASNANMISIPGTGEFIRMGGAAQDQTGAFLSLGGAISVKEHTSFADSGSLTTTGAVQTTNTTQTTAATISLADDTVYWMEADVVGRDTAGTHRSYHKFRMFAYREAAGGATLGTIDPTYTDESDAGLAATFTASGNDVLVSVTGLAATTINWSCTIRYQGSSGSS